MVLSLDVPGARCTCISTCEEVMSSTRLIFSLPFSTALVMESCTLSAVFVNGTSRMTSVFGSSFSIFALTLTTPPRCPSL